MTKLEIQTIDATTVEATAELQALRDQLSPSGNVVSPKGRALTERVFGQPLVPSQVVERICADVRQRGQAALRHYCLQLDNAELPAGGLRLEQARLEQAHRSATPEFLKCIRRIRDNIQSFQQAILHTTVTSQPSAGIRLDQRYQPLRRIGVCVPGGAAAYPSTVLMTVVPALAAGVQELAVVAPPTPFGAYNADVLATCHELGVSEVYPIGGAQAVAALAYGVEGLPAVDKIVGPGNLFVALAKKHVFGHVDIDSIAGPSEVVVIADQTTDPAYVAADILAQAEHSPGASLLITWHADLIGQVRQELERQLVSLSRSWLTLDSLNAFGALVRVRDADQAVELTNWIAPEHLHIACQQPRKLSERIRNAGAIFLGPFSPVSLGDYAAGPSHVLPTGGTARWAAGLSSNSFLRSSSVIEYSREALANIADEIAVLADKEGLTAHRESVAIRLRSS
ncbi:MAG: histidinol dehydrogenase [Pirellulaceae bacterium]|nr:histidinol dehydrogenase [Pirellulaceae bacterium]